MHSVSHLGPFGYTCSGDRLRQYMTYQARERQDCSVYLISVTMSTLFVRLSQASRHLVRRDVLLFAAAWMMACLAAREVRMLRYKSMAVSLAVSLIPFEDSLRRTVRSKIVNVQLPLYSISYSILYSLFSQHLPQPPVSFCCIRQTWGERWTSDHPLRTPSFCASDPMCRSNLLTSSMIVSRQPEVVVRCQV